MLKTSRFAELHSFEPKTQPRSGAQTLSYASKARASFLALLETCVGNVPVRFRCSDGDFTVGPTGAAPEFTLLARDPEFFARALAFGNLGLGESFMDRGFELTDGRLEDFLTLLLRGGMDQAVRTSLRAASQVLISRARYALRSKASLVRAHYDLGHDLFEAFLDSTLSYSCGYQQTPSDSLDELQHNKFERICQKLRLEPGMQLLDIGCGYGGLLMYAAQTHGVRGFGITNSRGHFERACERVHSAALSTQVRIECGDYSTLQGSFERVVSVGMLEHVPRHEYGLYFRTMQRLLALRGVALVHAIGCNAARNAHDRFIQKYIFPGSSQPRLSEIAAAAERSGLAIADVENMVRHYEPTLEAWLARFYANRDRLDPAKYDERFKRMWEYYLCAGIAAARASDAALYQVVLMKDTRDSMPLQRV